MTAFLFPFLMSATALALQTPVRSEAVKPPVDMIEVVCRVKAKEAAAHAYRSCLIDDKAAQVQDLKRKATRQVELRRQAKPQSKVKASAPVLAPKKIVNKLPAKKLPTVQFAPEGSTEVAAEPVIRPPETAAPATESLDPQQKWVSSDEAETLRGKVDATTDKVQVFKDESTTVEVQTIRPAEATEKELDAALEQIKISDQPKNLPKRAILIEDDSEVPEPEEF